jgi:hypothetical protein
MIEIVDARRNLYPNYFVLETAMINLYINTLLLIPPYAVL